MPVLDVSHLAVSFDSKPILRDINLRVHPGDVMAILGENGSGKSTLLRAATGLITPTAGTAKLFGVDTTNRREVPWHRLGYVPQRILAPTTIPATAAEVVRTGLVSTPWLRTPRSRDAIIAALDTVGLAHRADEKVATFSGGQAQRVAIARALVREPDLLVLDEPTAGVDERRRKEVADLLGELAAEGRAILLVLHDLGHFAHVITRTATIAQGVISHECVVIDGVPHHVDPAEDAFHEIAGHDTAFDETGDTTFASADNPIGW